MRESRITRRSNTSHFTTRGRSSQNTSRIARGKLPNMPCASRQKITNLMPRAWKSLNPSRISSENHGIIPRVFRVEKTFTDDPQHPSAQRSDTNRNNPGGVHSRLRRGLQARPMHTPVAMQVPFGGPGGISEPLEELASLQRTL